MYVILYFLLLSKIRYKLWKMGLTCYVEHIIHYFIVPLYLKGKVDFGGYWRQDASADLLMFLLIQPWYAICIKMAVMMLVVAWCNGWKSTCIQIDHLFIALL